MLKEIRRGIYDCSEEELIFILGDFNAHLGIIGEPDVNNNRKIVLDMMIEDNMILPSDTEKSTGIYWEEVIKSVIDFILVNILAYKLCQEMNIDEKQDKFNLSDHNLIKITLITRHQLSKRRKIGRETIL